MDELRRQRYLDKIATVERRARQVAEWAQGVDAAGLQRDPKTQLAIYKAVQEIVEASMDVCAMRLRDSGLSVGDDYRNVDLLEERRDLGADLARVLRESNGLRNRLVHAYDTVRDDLVLAFIETRLPVITQITQEARRWLTT